MNFLSAAFLLFLLLTMLCYYLAPKRWQNGLLLAANYVFYMWQSPAFGALLLSGTAVGYGCARMIQRGKRRKFWLVVCVIYTFGLLFLFKYLNFVCGLVLRAVGGAADATFLHLALPIGISFFSFSIAGYAIDVYRGKMEAERNFVAFAAFASFFPSILSGPINRSRELLPQLHTARAFSAERWKRGLWRFLCGAGKKLVVAGGLSVIVNTVYAQPTAYGAAMWALTAVCYSLQIYVDFASYSDMAIGVADMMGIELMENFSAPYLSCTVKSFWKKWHISLTSWFREYLYFPLGGSKKGVWRTRLNVMIVFAVSGLWHGAAMTFVIWGVLNGLYQVCGDLTMRLRERIWARLPIPKPLRKVWQMLFTFALITVTWIFFRASSVAEAWFIIRRILLVFHAGFGVIPKLMPWREAVVLLLALVGCFVEDCRIAAGKGIQIARTSFRFWLFCALLVLGMLLFGHYGPGFSAQDFVYFKF